MLIKLTSASENLLGQTIGLNPEFVVSVLSGEVLNEKSEKVTRTFVFCPPHGTWEVQQTVDEVIDMINKGIQ